MARQIAVKILPLEKQSQMNKSTRGTSEIIPHGTEGDPSTKPGETSIVMYGWG